MQLEPLSYHIEVARRLQADERDLWDWFQSDAFAARYKEKAGEDLLQSGIRLDRSGANEARYVLAEKARDTLGLSEPIALYQKHDSKGSQNAHLVFVPSEIVISFEGRILDLLQSDAELLDLFGHEIAYYKLLRADGGRFHTASRMLQWILQREHCQPVFIETRRRYQLYTKVYCDIGGLIACGDFDATIRGLVRVIANSSDAEASSYLAQAQELVAKGLDGSGAGTHPELHLRVLAAANAAAMEPNAFNEAMGALVAGKIELGALDLIDQQALRDLTRGLLDRVLSSTDAQSDSAITHARQMFSDYASPVGEAVPLQPQADGLSGSTIDYLAYVLLDLATVDANGSSAAIAVCTDAADELGIGARFREIARQELKGRRAILSGLVQRAA